VEDSLTSGRIRVVCAPEARELIAGEVATFEALYPQAKIELIAGTSRDAKAALFGARADLAVITTEITPEERAAAVRGRLQLEGYRFARDAVVLITHRSNVVENVALDRVRRVYSGDLKSWKDLGGDDQAIEPVVQPPGSDITSYVVEEIMSGQPIQARAIYAENDSAVGAKIKQTPGSLGYVSLGADVSAVKVLRVAPMGGLPYWKPDLEAVYKDEYPLTRFFSFYIRNDGPRLANGLITFVTSQQGQAIVHQHRLVPTAVPVRFVRRSPMLGDH
jgi:phosphate transport system substrate-binding protein